MAIGPKDEGTGGMASLIFAIASLMGGDPANAAESALVRTIQREADLDLDDDQILYVVRDTGEVGGDPELALRRLRFLSDATRASRR